jgi:hypothetical protein
MEWDVSTARKVIARQSTEKARTQAPKQSWPPSNEANLSVSRPEEGRAISTHGSACSRTCYNDLSLVERLIELLAA